MDVAKSNIQKHFGWLREHIEPYGISASVIQLGEDPSREFRLTSRTEYGVRESPSPPKWIAKFKFRNPILTIPRPEVLWRFRERWQVLRHPRTNVLVGFEFLGMSLILMGEPAVEYLSIHWNDPPGSNEKYQPHWHVGISGERYFIDRVHIPQNVEWSCLSPPNLDFYYSWLDKLLAFINEEFPRCLIKAGFCE